MNRHKTFFVESIKQYNFLDSKFIELRGGEYEIPFRIEPTKGEHSIESCENCRNKWLQLIDEINIDFEKFPNCCELHVKLLQLDIFDKNDFAEIPTIIADKIMYSYHHVINNLDNDDWYEDISEYFEYIFASFGSFPYGYGEPYKRGVYLSALKSLLISIEGKFTSHKIDTIDIKTRMNKVLSLLEPVALNSNPQKDFNLLLSKYNEWYKIFPFDLPYFKHLKEKFRKTLPMYTGRVRHNKYLKATERELHSKDSFATVLLKITKDIITSINGLTLFEQGLITDGEKHRIDLIVNNRKLELFELTSMSNKSDRDYIKILKKWFREEKKFISEITPLLQSEKKTASSDRPNRTDIAYYCYYTSQTKTLNISNVFPSDKAWTEIGNKFNKNPKNIQQTYNLIATNKEERLKSAKIKTINYVIENMLSDSVEGKKLAKDELKYAQTYS